MRKASFSRARALERTLGLKRNASTTCSLATGNGSTTYRERIQRLNGKVNAFVSVSPIPESANLPKDAKGKGKLLDGLCVAVKDNISTSDMRTTCSSAILRDYTSPFDATVVARLRSQGADVLGKTNCDEFGMGSLNTHSIHGPVMNPAYLYPCEENAQPEERVAGGSSGGSAAAVAAGLCDAALGTDTGGSIRLPASYCGVVGFKPSYGLLSRWGVVSYADSLDCVGVFAKDVERASVVFDALEEFDPRDPTSAPKSIREEAEDAWTIVSRSSPLQDLRIGVPQEYFPLELSSSTIAPFRAALELLQSAGAQIIPVSLPTTTYALSAYYVLASAEASSNLARYDGVEFGSYVPPPFGSDLRKTANVYAQTRTAGFGKEVQKRILLGTYALSADAFENYFLQAERIRQLIRNDYDNVFQVPNVYSSSPRTASAKETGVHVLLHPSAIGPAPLLAPNANSGSETDTSKVPAYVQDVLTVPASLAGLPAISLPMSRGIDSAGREKGSKGPVGLSIVGQWGSDRAVLAVAREYERLVSQL